MVWAAIEHHGSEEQVVAIQRLRVLPIAVRVAIDTRQTDGTHDVVRFRRVGSGDHGSLDFGVCAGLYFNVLDMLKTRLAATVSRGMFAAWKREGLFFV